MLSIKYYFRVLSGMSFKKFSEVLDRAHRFSGKSKLWLACDMVHCARKFGAGYYDYVTFGFWDLNDAQRETYVTRIVSKKLNVALNDQTLAGQFEDKAAFQKAFAAYTGREFINFRESTKEEVRAFIEKYPRCFSKPAQGSCGRGCQILDSREYPSFDAFYEDLEKNDAWLLEKVLEQHLDNKAVYPLAMNCMRLITLVDSWGKPHVIFATQKFGLDGRVVDNYGFGCRVDLETGKICSPGVSGDGSLAVIYHEHPMTHVPLLGRQVPMFFEACELVKKAAMEFPKMRYIGWDVGITPDGPAIVEGNIFCAHDFWQLPAQTPEKQGMKHIFRELAPEVDI